MFVDCWIVRQQHPGDDKTEGIFIDKLTSLRLLVITSFILQTLRLFEKLPRGSALGVEAEPEHLLYFCGVPCVPEPLVLD